MALVTVVVLGATTLPAGFLNEAAAKYFDDFARPRGVSSDDRSGSKKVNRERESSSSGVTHQLDGVESDEANGIGGEDKIAHESLSIGGTLRAIARADLNREANERATADLHVRRVARVSSW
jgi:hypothetical protein